MLSPKQMWKTAEIFTAAGLCLGYSLPLPMREQYRIRVVVYSLGHVRLCTTPWTVALQAPLSMEFSRQEYWSGLPFPSPGHLPDPRIEPASSALQVDSLPPSHQGSLHVKYCFSLNTGITLPGEMFLFFWVWGD